MTTICTERLSADFGGSTPPEGWPQVPMSFWYHRHDEPDLARRSDNGVAQLRWKGSSRASSSSP
jgi:hypothetical protein